SGAQHLREALLVTGFAYDFRKPERNNIPHFVHFLYKSQALRRDGSAALNLAYVAAGRFDGFWELGLNLWDYAAGILLIQEAGGIILGTDGKPLKLGSGSLIGGNRKIAQAIYREFPK